MRTGSAILTLLLTGLALLADPLAGGKYHGKWEGVAGGSGDFDMTLTAAEGGKWVADVEFSLGGQQVKCTVKSIVVTDSKLHVVYSFDLQGNQLESTIDGEMSGPKLGGKYTTRAVGDGTAIDEGTWATTASN